MSTIVGAKPGLILAYSGCDRDIGDAALSSPGRAGLVASNNGYDWLGTGVYFWENDPVRAFQWAEEAKRRHLERNQRDGTLIRVHRPFAVGAVINLGTCLDLTTIAGIDLIKAAYDGLMKYYDLLLEKEPKFKIPENTKDKDMKGRFLDFAVINYACQQYLKTHEKPIDTVRAFFYEGKKAYPTAGFKEKTHTQICVREQQRAILGYFRITT